MLREKAQLVIHQKLTSPQGLLRELKVWSLKRSERYPEGIKYRLALANPATGEVHLLYDNHWPKGHHRHIGQREIPYAFDSLEVLIRDFRDAADSIERSLK